MNSRWSDKDAADFVTRYAPAWGEALAARTYTSRLLGIETSLVLHGGGNTSVKGTWRTALGETVAAIFVKASGSDLATIEPEAFPPLDLAYLQRLRAIDSLDDELMVNEIRTHLFNHRSPTPSIETLVHAFMPAPYVDHTHADAILTLSNQAGGAGHLREALGEDAFVLDYIEPGFQLARATAAAVEAFPRARCLVLMRHGLITWGDTARAAYEATVEMVTRAENHAASRAKRGRTMTVPGKDVAASRDRLARIGPIVRGQLARATGDPDLPWDRVVVVPLLNEEVLGILASNGAKEALVTPPLTTDHLIRTKSLPLWVDAPDYDQPAAFRDRLRSALNAYTEHYRAYLDRHRALLPAGVAPFDPLPRVVLLPGLGALCAGRDVHDAIIARDITAQTLRVKSVIAGMGGYEGLGERDLFMMEYRGLQHAKLAGVAKPLSGRTALISGSAGAIGAGIAHELLERGAHVAVTDLAGERLDRLTTELGGEFPGHVAGVPMDVTSAESVAEAFREVILAWGGVDLVIVNAGIAKVAALAEIDLEAFRRLERVNIDGHAAVARRGRAPFRASRDRRRYRGGVHQERLRARRPLWRLQRHQGRLAPAGAHREPGARRARRAGQHGVSRCGVFTRGVAIGLVGRGRTRPHESAGPRPGRPRGVLPGAEPAEGARDRTSRRQRRDVLRDAPVADDRGHYPG